MDLKQFEDELDELAAKAFDAGIPKNEIIKVLEAHAEGLREIGDDK